jgi:hypothetical protein
MPSAPRSQSENEHIRCWECGHARELTNWRFDKEPVCRTCLIHLDGHRMDPRCPLCLVERRTALKESLRIERWQLYRQRGESNDASNS